MRKAPASTPTVARPAARNRCFVDAERHAIDQAVLRDVRKGTKVRLIVQQSPYTKPATWAPASRCLVCRSSSLCPATASVDSGDLSVEDVAGIFGSVEGYKASEPAVRDEPTRFYRDL